MLLMNSITVLHCQYEGEVLLLNASSPFLISYLLINDNEDLLYSTFILQWQILSLLIVK